MARATIGYHASHEQFRPSELLTWVKAAAAAGFEAAMCSDHFHPWGERQGQSGFAFAWLGAALHATRFPMGVVNAPGQRYHPAIVAQAAATLAEMFPRRFWLAVGSGENVNEHVTGDPWLPKEQRNARLRECVDVLRALWAGETVEHDGLVRVHAAKLYTLPATPPRLYCAAITKETAAWAGSWADGLLTVAQPKEKLERVVDAFRSHGGDGKPLLVQMKLSYAATEEEARRAAYDQWRTNALEPPLLADLETPSDFDTRSASVTPDDLDDHVHVSADLGRHLDAIERLVDMGFSEVYLHHVGRDQGAFLDAFAERVLPALR